MKFFDVIKTRRSIRKYRPDTVSDEDIKYILNAARLAPSAKNRQCWRYVVVKDKKLIEEIASSRPESKEWIAEAPVIIVVCADPNESSKREGKELYLFDLGISFEHLLLAAKDKGLATCCICGFDEKTVKNTIGVPENMRVVAFTPLGYGDEEKGEVTDRKSLEEIVSYEKYEQKK